MNYCGKCKYYEQYIINGLKVKRGKCIIARTDYFIHNLKGNKYKAKHSQYRPYSNKACSRYEIKQANK